MRLHFDLTPNKQVVPFDYQHLLVGTFHKWMGMNELHNEISLYSFGWLKGGEISKTGFQFKKGAQWFISFWDEEIGKQLIKNAMKDPEMFCGISVSEIIIQENPQFTSKETFSLSSPVLIRKYDENRRTTHLTFNDLESDHFLTETLQRKLKLAELDYEVNIKFDRDYQKATTKLVTIKGIKNKTSLCPVIIEGEPTAIQFAWNVGIGHSTGSGFGSLF